MTKSVPSGNISPPPIDHSDHSALIFDRPARQRQRDRVAGNYDSHAFLIREVAGRLHDNYRDITRDFQHIVDLGCHGGELAALLPGKIVIQQDISRRFLERLDGLRVQADEEMLPYRTESLDLVLSNLSLHWVNDLPGCLIQIRQALKPDGLFLATLFGGNSLFELRQSMMAAELTIRQGASPHIAPFMDIQAAGSLLQRAGFALPVVDTERITVNYDNAFKLMQDIKGMGQSNSLLKRFQGLTHPTFLAETARQYQTRFSTSQGRITASFDILYLMGWAPHTSQQKPLKPGQGKVNFNDFFNTT